MIIKEKNLNTIFPAVNGGHCGKYDVKVFLMVEMGVCITDVKAVNNPGFGTKDVAIREIK